MKTLRLLLTFYRYLAGFSITISIMCLAILIGFGSNGVYIVAPLFWYKVFTLVAGVYIINNYKKREFYYYKNLGLSKLKLWIPILLFDFVLFLIALKFLASHLHDTQAGS